jgi:hypothetical protein
MDHNWTCRCCGKQFSTLPLSFAATAPDSWFAIPAAERQKRALLTSDQCILDNKYFFVRGCLEIPIVARSESFDWGLWVSLSQASFEHVNNLRDTNVRKTEPSLFGWLCNELSIYPQTFGLKTKVHLRSGGQRPFIELEPTAHPLAQEQRSGRTLQRVEEIASALLPRH